MARTKQTARKNTGGKPLAMGRGKPHTNPPPKPGGRVDRKVIIEYSSDESFYEERPQPVEGFGAPKRVTKQIHLTLPTLPSHVTTMESFTTFFINHGLTKALRKAFEKQGWSTDEMQELITNFQRKHGKKVSLPKLYQDEDSSYSEGLELGGRDQVVVAAQGQVQEAAVLVALVALVVAQAEVSSAAEMMMTLMMILTKGGRQAILPNHQDYRWPEKNHDKVSPRMADSTLVWG